VVPARRLIGFTLGDAEMSLQICPKCGRRGMTWSIDEEVSPLTQWDCSLFRYSVQQDESRESTCPACGTENSYLLLSDTSGAFWFCLTCQSRSPATGVA
jgi:ssDNA-binding Zn-finger/Zn-ribbon topoisomerase 1